MGRYKVDIPDELWRRARIEALNEGVTISQWVEHAIAHHVPKEGSRAETNKQTTGQDDH